MGDKGKHDLIMIQEKLKAFSFGGAASGTYSKGTSWPRKAAAVFLLAVRRGDPKVSSKNDRDAVIGRVCSLNPLKRR
jgi:hypothetical protein